MNVTPNSPMVKLIDIIPSEQARRIVEMAERVIETGKLERIRPGECPPSGGGCGVKTTICNPVQTPNVHLK